MGSSATEMIRAQLRRLKEMMDDCRDGNETRHLMVVYIRGCETLADTELVEAQTSAVLRSSEEQSEINRLTITQIRTQMGAKLS